MKRHRVLSFLLCMALIIGFLPIEGNAYERDDHDDLMLEILFTKYEYACTNRAAKTEIDVLTSACYLTIDQFNNSGKKDLERLLSYGVQDIPTSVDEINYSASGATHRNFTHKGWSFDYGMEMKTKWPLRQKILRNTVGTVFNFKGNEKQKEAFCELLYYIHILGDHKDDTSYKVSNGIKIGVGGRRDKEDIIHKLLNLSKSLFPNQINTHKYRALITNLQSINSELSKVVTSDGDVNTEEEFAQYQALTDDVIEILSLYLPEMLKDEPFFYEVFYQQMDQADALDWLDDLLNAA